ENSTRAEGTNIPKIPSLPISWENAKVLLESEGKRVRLVNNGTPFSSEYLTVVDGLPVDTKITPIWNAMAVIPGFIKDEVVVVGNHRDAWVRSSLIIKSH